MVPVSIADEDNGPTEDQKDNNFYELPSKKLKYPKHIVLYVPGNIVVMAAVRRKIISDAFNDVIASILKESQGCVETFALSQRNTLRRRQKLRFKKLETIKENIRVDVNNQYFTMSS